MNRIKPGVLDLHVLRVAVNAAVLLEFSTAALQLVASGVVRALGISLRVYNTATVLALYDRSRTIAGFISSISSASHLTVGKPDSILNFASHVNGAQYKGTRIFVHF